MTILDDYHGLLDLVLLEGSLGRKFELNGVPCEIENWHGNALLVAGNAEFAIAAVFPLWYLGGCPPYPASTAIVGDPIALFQWLPISPDDKRELIARLPLDHVDRAMLMLAV